MHYNLVSPEDYEGLPEDDELKFVALEGICRRNLNDMLSGDTHENFETLIRLQYMYTINAMADELGIRGISINVNSQKAADQFERFMLDVIGIITKIRLRSRRDGDPNSVRLSTKTRALIQREIDKLRGIIEGADLAASKREALLKKLDELASEIDKNRVGFGKALAVMAFIMAGGASATSFLADAPNAVATITKLLGLDKAAEDAEKERLGGPAPQRALPAPAKIGTSAEASGKQEVSTDDDEIPF